MSLLIVRFISSEDGEEKGRRGERAKVHSLRANSSVVKMLAGGVWEKVHFLHTFTPCIYKTMK